MGRLVQTVAGLNSYVQRGTVIGATPGFHGYTVQLVDGTTIPCIPPESASGVLHGLGSVSSSVLSPGTAVVVLQSGIGSGFGIILTSYDNRVVVPSKDKNRKYKSDEAASADYSVEDPYKDGSESVKSQNTPTVGMYKASDTYPGDWMVANEFGMEYFLGRTRMTMRGSNMSRIDLFPIDDVFRVVAGYLQMQTHGGKEIVFADQGGFVSREILFSPYVWETGGCLTKSEFEGKTKVPEGDGSAKPPDIENPDLARYREFWGSIAGGRQIFVSYPKGDKNVGLSHVTFSDSGALVFRSVSDIIFSKTDKIDVPVRIKNPEDRDGVKEPNIEGKDETPVEEDWWRHDIGRRTVSNIVKQLYKRFENNDKDWRIDSEKAESEYDETAGSKSDVGGGASQIVLGHDGSITFSTSKGAEIRLDGADITISCPGNLSFRSGGSVYVLSNNDTIVKSKSDCEILSKNNTVVSAEKRVSTFAGVSIFSEVGDSKKESKKFPDTGGYDTPGIYMKVAKNKGRVLMDTDDVIVHPRRSIDVSAVDDNGKTKKNTYLRVGIGSVSTSAFSIILDTGSGSEVSSGLMLSPSSATLFGESAGVASGGVPYLIGGGKTPWMLPAEGSGPYSSLCSDLRDVRSVAMFKKNPFVEKLPYFSYKAYFDVVDGRSPEVEESTWVNIVKPGGAWGKDMEVNGTYPWPGADGKCVQFNANYGGLMNNDDDLGDKKDPESKPKRSKKDFKEYRG